MSASPTSWISPRLSRTDAQQSAAQDGQRSSNGVGYEQPIDVKTAARFLGVSASLVYAYVERKQIPHFRMMGRAIRFRLSELEGWRQKFHVNGGIDG